MCTITILFENTAPYEKTLLHGVRPKNTQKMNIS